MRRKPLAAIAIAALAVTAFAACGDDDDDTPDDTMVVGGRLGPRRVDHDGHGSWTSTTDKLRSARWRRPIRKGRATFRVRAQAERIAGSRERTRSSRPPSEVEDLEAQRIGRARAGPAPRRLVRTHDAGDAGGVGPGHDRPAERHGHALSAPRCGHGDEQVGSVRRRLVDAGEADDLTVDHGGERDARRRGLEPPDQRRRRRARGRAAPPDDRVSARRASQKRRTASSRLGCAAATTTNGVASSMSADADGTMCPGRSENVNSAPGRGSRQMTTTVVPTWAKFHMNAASGLAWRWQPPDSRVPSSASVW